MNSKEVLFKIAIGDFKHDSKRYINMITLELEEELIKHKFDTEKQRMNSKKGDRGDLIEIGQLLIAFISGGTITAFLKFITDWITRYKQNSIEIEIKKTAEGELVGKRFKVTGSGVTTEVQKQIIDKLVKELDG